MKKINLIFVLISICFLAFSQAPTITSFSPASGPVGTLVTVRGTNLSNPTAFTIGGVSAIIVSNGSDSIVGMVMPGALTGAISVLTLAGIATGGGSFTITQTLFPATQQGPKLVGTGGVGLHTNQGVCSISADGNTAIVGGYSDNSSHGAAWVYTRLGTTWTQQGSKLVGTGAVGAAGQGQSVSISADGNTAIVGGPYDNSDTGAVWIFTRSGSTWNQQGNKLVGNGANGNSQQGYSVSLSVDGNTAIVGGPNDNNFEGAAWVYTRSGTTWTQQGNKLVGTGATSNASEGISVSLSADGNTAIIGGDGDNVNIGASWVFVRSGVNWAQQGNKLVGISSSAISYQGCSVSLSADGNTAMIGGQADNNATGAAWVFTRTNNVWTEEGPKLTTAADIGCNQGCSVSLSADGNTAIVGGPGAYSATGGLWIYMRSGGVWTQQGPILVGTGVVGAAEQGQSVTISADGNTAIVGGQIDNTGVGAAWIFTSICSPDSSALTYAICQGDTFIFGSQPLTSSGTYIDTLTNIRGCDSIVTLRLTVHSLPAISFTWDSLSQARDVYGINSAFANWSLGCYPNIFVMKGGFPTGGYYSGRFIHNDTASIILSQIDWSGIVDTITYTFTDSNGCINKASALLILHGPCEGIQNIPDDPIHLYPNPNKGSFTLQTSVNINSEYVISDMLGHIVVRNLIKSDKQSIDMPDAAEGVYTLSVAGAAPVKFVVLR